MDPPLKSTEHLQRFRNKNCIMSYKIAFNDKMNKVFLKSDRQG